MINVTVTHSDFNIINDECCNIVKFKKETNNEPPIKLLNIDLDIFTPEIKLKLQKMSDETEKILNEHRIIKYEAHYTVLIVIISCIIIVFCIFKFILYIK